MKPLLKKILATVALLLVVFLIFVAAQPGAFAITRSTTIAAPPEAVFPHVNDLKKWEAWSPWSKLDPAMKQTYGGPGAGVGATYAWDGDSKVCAGRMTILESRTNEFIRIKLDFLKPMEASNASDFSLKPEGRQTVVTWTMTGTNNFIGKAVCVFMNMDKLVGGQFEQGLASMKALAEGGPKK